ncbi:MAG: transketolase C-terminal domain-containing protein, partial [Nitratireductor sp.]
ERKEWEGRLTETEAEIRSEFERRMRGELPGGFEAAIADYKKALAKDKPKVATRKSSEMALEIINAALPETIGGSADLTGSNNTKTSQTGPIAPGDYSGRYVYYGIREHGMAAAMNGMALHGGIIPYGGTFLVFTDYCRPAIRLSALMGQRVIYVMTHDSIGLGEDGPTHQPVEHLSALRTIPNLRVYRPADAVETAECWQLALEDGKAPSILALTRQNLPAVRTNHSEENLCRFGAYDLAPASDDEVVTLFATGSEVEIALAAQRLLEAKGHPARVVSVPSMERFAMQSAEYHAAIVGSAAVKVAIEAGVRQSWDRLIGSDGIFIGMDGFGASAPYEQLYSHFGITAEAVVEAVEARLASLN